MGHKNRIYKVFSFVGVVVLSLLTTVAYPQEKDIKFNHITVDGGLASNTINSVIRDSRGFMWIATANGLNRYDGYTFENFRSHELDTLSISSNITYVVYEDHQERVWVGSEKGLDLFNRKLGRFDHHFFKDSSVRVVYEDSKNRLWVGVDGGIFVYNEQKELFEKYFHNIFFEIHADLYNTSICILEDHNENLWIGTSNGGVFVYNFKTQKFKDYYHDPKKRTSISDNNIRSIIQDKQHRIWIATYGGGINLFQPETETFKSFTESDPGGLSNNLTNIIWEDDQGKLWIGTDGNGLDIFDPQKEFFTHIIHSPFNSRSLNNNVVRTISSDGRGGIWVGTYAGGINFFNRNTEAFFHYKVPTFNGNSSTTSFAEDERGNIWIGTDGGGLCYFDKNTGQIQNYKHDKKNKNSLSDNRIMSLVLDDEGYLWIGTYLGGLCRYELSSGKFKQFTIGDQSGISDNIIWTVIQDSKGRIWAGTNRGLNLYNPDTEKFKCYTIVNSALSNNMVRALYEDRKNRLWIGTQDGLDLYHDSIDDFSIIRSNLKKPNSLSNNWIRTIQEDCHGNILVGTFEGGINVFNISTNSFYSFKEKEGLPDNMISGILSDCHDNLWISTGKGLARLNIANKSVKSYFVNDGLQDNQFNINAAYETRQGEFLFGGINGFTLFVPEVITHIKPNKFPPPLVLTSLKIFNKEVVPDTVGSPLRAHIHETSEIKLPYDQTVLTFEFAALNFIQPDKNQYSYRLVGFEENWNYVGNKRSGTYTNLEHGEYIFQVKASNNDGVWSKDPLMLKVIIMPPYWETGWFKVLILAFAISVILIIANIVRKRIRAKIKINKVIADLKIKALIAQMNPHFIFNCLTSIQELILVNKQDEGMYYLEQFSKLLRIVLQSSEKNFIPLRSEIKFLELYLELEAMRFSKQFHYSIEVDPAIDPDEIIIPCFLIQPFVENAIWHGLMQKKGERNVDVSFYMEKDGIVCSIEDDGIGREAAARINSKKNRTYQSMGLKIIRERMQLMKQQNSAFNLKITDEMNDEGTASGTSVVIKMPLWLNREGRQSHAMDKEEELIFADKDTSE